MVGICPSSCRRLDAGPRGASRENVLSGVDATSASNIWAVGGYHNGTACQNLALHFAADRAQPA